SKLKQVERMEKIEAPTNDDKKIKFRFPQPMRSGQKVITLKDIHHAYGQNVIYRGMEFLAERTQRTVLVGPNGAGKSTLLKILAGVLEFQSGERILGHNVKAGYYSQYRVDMLQPNRTVFEEAADTPQAVTEQFIRTILGSFLFRGDDVFKKVSVLSGGEKSRLALVKLLLDPPNLLLMDEPTTHLDMASIDALLGALKQFEGTIIFISHDVYFIRELSNHVVRVENGKLQHFPGGYQYYLDKTAQTSAQQALVSSSQAVQKATPVQKPVDRKLEKRLEAEKRQERSRQRKAYQEKVTNLEAQIVKLEAKQRELTAELEKPETYEKSGLANSLNRDLARISDELDQVTPQWEKAAADLLHWEKTLAEQADAAAS
ncbi:MAG: ATP-binding cassette domain-containing protein, partial [Limisphaerales bacterium]